MISDQIRAIIIKELDHVLENEPLMNYTTMRVGGVADFVYIAEKIDDLIKALRVCFVHRIPYLIFGSGSNIIASDAGFPGLVIINCSQNMAFVSEKSQVIVDSGCVFARLITEAAGRGLGGMEWWFGLPGTIGGAVHNNAETWGHSMGEIVKQITLLFPPTGESEAKMEQVDVKWMQYQYRSSRLKTWHGEGKPIILTVTLQLRRQPKEEILRKMKELKQGRWDLNQPKGVASAGSYFKNPGGSSHDDAVTHRPEDSAGWLLDQVGAKNITIGHATPSSHHANFITNTGSASASEIKELAKLLKEKVKLKFDVDLDEEVEYLGVWKETDDERRNQY